MNKAKGLFDVYFKITQDREKSKKCVMVFVEEIEKLAPHEFKMHSTHWWAGLMQEIREDLEFL